MAKLFNDAGVVVITSFISPFENDREMAKNIIGKQYFKEIFIETTLEICIERDTKGLYKKAMNGELKDFTGISSPYQQPLKPDFVVSTSHILPDESVDIIFRWLMESGLFLIK